MSKNDNDGINSKDFLIGTLVGGMVGAATALLLAPKSGKDLRNDLNSQTSVLREKGNEFATIALEKSTNLAKSVSDQSSQVAGKVKEFRGSVKNDGAVTDTNTTSAVSQNMKEEAQEAFENNSTNS